MQRIVHALTLHSSDKQSDRLHHHYGIAGLDGDDHIVKALAFADTQELHTALHNTLWGITIARHDAVGERTVVHTDTHGRMVLTANLQQRQQPLLNLLQFGGILLVGIFQLLERTGRVGIVAGVDAHLLHIMSRHLGHSRIEVDIGHKRHLASPLPEFLGNEPHVLRFLHPLGGESHIFASSLNNAQRLRHRSLDVIGRGGGHRLDSDGVVASEWRVAHFHLCGLASGIIKQIGHGIQ